MVDYSIYEGYIRNNNIGEAIHYLRELLKENPTGKTAGEIYEKLGYCGYLTCNMRLAADCYVKAAQNDEILKNQVEHFSSFLFCLQYIDGISPADLTKNIAYYDRFFQEQQLYKHCPNKNIIRKLRIGYLSADWREHAMADFLSPFVSNFDEEKFEVFAYVLNEADNYTYRFKELGQKAIWRDLNNISPLEGAETIYQDHIDILVDLGGHSHGGAGLLIMANKPAPLQMSGLGWINTTGLSTVDYFLTDRVCCKLAEDEDLFCEKPLVLEGPQLCYAPLERDKFCFVTKPLGRYKRQGTETVYGVFSNYNKITDEMLRVWDTILSQVPDSLLVLKDTTGELARQEALRARMGKLGLKNVNQIIVEQGSRDYLDCYRDIDIVLDTYPYTGGATVCEALYMGRPVLALRGDNHGRRFSSSILENAGLRDFITSDKEEYIKKAAAMGKDKEHLHQLQQKISDKFMHSSVMDSQAYMRELEGKYQEIWENFVLRT